MALDSSCVSISPVLSETDVEDIDLSNDEDVNPETRKAFFRLGGNKSLRLNFDHTIDSVVRGMLVVLIVMSCKVRPSVPFS